MNFSDFKKKAKEKTSQVVDFTRNNWKGLLLLAGSFAALAYLSSKDSDDESTKDDNFDSLYNDEVREMKFSKKWLRNATDDELDSEREKVRKRYVGINGIDEASRLYDILHSFDNEMIDRANLKYEKEHPDAKPRHREHGWYLSNDD